MQDRDPIGEPEIDLDQRTNFAKQSFDDELLKSTGLRMELAIKLRDSLLESSGPHGAKDGEGGLG